MSSVACWITIAAVILSSAARAEPPTAPRPGGQSGPGGQSIYQLQSRWTTDTGDTLRLADLAGQYQIVAFIFTHCAGVCPTLIKSLQVQARNLPTALSERTRFLLVSIDPQHDTQSELRRFRQDLALSSNWTLLRGSDPDLRELTAVLGFNYQQQAPGQFTHSNLLTLLNPSGEIVLQHPLAEGAIAAMSEAIAASR